ncbi:ATP-binding cassette domain-containing protein [Listeria monocytogenes]|nr:ATP-binding cassette domain-containing protein [Listeria monocytogenes]EAF9012011.1 ATP-binding cassette domain-containing protein [Listeria monocytogenes]EAF9053992.1 ATP-binding cassette domain-containing protein [Listeria monocytogenes]EAF9078522.1 ATP-binding cassette domain-containing protein [Listeria monocytogenes]
MLEVNRLYKYFGDFPALSDVSFNLKQGETLGIIGQNGAGKTTIFRLLLGFLNPEQGEISWTIDTKDFLNSVGYLPEERGLHVKRTIENQISFFGSLKGMSEDDINIQMDYWFDKFQVTATKKQKISSLSKGNKQKIQLICSILHRPKFLILDEPYSGLDPVNSAVLSEGIRMLKENGTTIIFSSHNMDNVEHISDNIMMLKQGNVVLNGNINVIKDSFGKTNILVENKPGIKEKISALPGVVSLDELTDNTLKIKVNEESIGEKIFDLVISDGYTNTFKQSPPTLEEIFKIKAGDSHE